MFLPRTGGFTSGNLPLARYGASGYNVNLGTKMAATSRRMLNVPADFRYKALVAPHKSVVQHQKVHASWLWRETRA